MHGLFYHHQVAPAKCDMAERKYGGHQAPVMLRDKT